MRSMFPVPMITALCVSILISFPRSASAQSTPAVTITAPSMDQITENLGDIIDLAGESYVGFSPRVPVRFAFLSAYVGRLKGIDRMRPFGIYSVDGPGSNEISLVGVFPVIDGDALAESLVEDFFARISEGAKGTKELLLWEGGRPLFYRIDGDHGYLASSPDAIPDGSLMAPDELFGESDAGDVVCFVRPAGLPKSMIRSLFARPDLQGAAAAAMETIDEIDVVGLRVGFDQPSGRLTIDAHQVPKPGTALARSVASAGDRPNRFASLRSDDSVATILVSGSVKDSLDGNPRLAPFASMLGGIVDLDDFAMLVELRRHPDILDAMLFVALALRDSRAAQAMVVPMAQQFLGPEGFKPSEKELGDASLYELTIPFPPGEPTRTDPVLVAFTADSLMAAFGDDSLETLRKATTTPPSTKAGTPFVVDVSWTKALSSLLLLRVSAKDRHRLPEFRGWIGNTRWTVTGGKRLALRLEIDLADFFSFVSIINRIGTAAEREFGRKFEDR